MDWFGSVPSFGLGSVETPQARSQKQKKARPFAVPVSARPDGASEHGFGLTALSTALKAGGGRLLRKVLLTAVWVASLV